MVLAMHPAKEEMKITEELASWQCRLETEYDKKLADWTFFYNSGCLSYGVSRICMNREQMLLRAPTHIRGTLP